MHHTQLKRTARYRQTPKGQYAIHKSNARARGVEFNLTFEQWWKVWHSDGTGHRYARRGNRKGRYVMARHADHGPYEQGNVSIQLFQANVAERNQTVVHKRHTARTTTVTFPNDSAA